MLTETQDLRILDLKPLPTPAEVIRTLPRDANVTRTVLEGRDAIRRFLEKFGAGQTEIAWSISRHSETGDLLMVEGVDDYVNAEGVRIRTPYAGVFEFRDGRIWRWRGGAWAI